MALSVKHLFQSAKGDGPDSTRVRPTDWNAEHQLLVDTDGVILGRPAGAGPGPITDIPLASVFPTGAVIAFAGATAPSGWLMCFGQLVSRSLEPGLHAVMQAAGYPYGAGDGVTNFGLPDLRGTGISGKSNMGGSDRGNLPGGATLGQYLGAATHQLTWNEMPLHTHGDSGHLHGNENGWSFAVRDAGYGPVPYVGGGPGGTIGYTNSTNWGYASLANAGLNYAHNNVQPTLVMNWIIKR